MLYKETGPIRPFAPAYGVYPTSTTKYTFSIDGKGNVRVNSQTTMYPLKDSPVVGEWVTEVNIKDDIKIPYEMLDIIDRLLEENDVYFTSHWKFVVEMIRKIKENASEIYTDVYVKNERLTETVQLLTLQKEQLERRLNTYERR